MKAKKIPFFYFFLLPSTYHIENQNSLNVRLTTPYLFTLREYFYSQGVNIFILTA